MLDGVYSRIKSSLNLRHYMQRFWKALNCFLCTDSGYLNKCKDVRDHNYNQPERVSCSCIRISCDTEYSNLEVLKDETSFNLHKSDFYQYRSLHITLYIKDSRLQRWVELILLYPQNIDVLISTRSVLILNRIISISYKILQYYDIIYI